jgi:hypothetical protein
MAYNLYQVQMAKAWTEVSADDVRFECSCFACQEIVRYPLELCVRSLLFPGC